MTELLNTPDETNPPEYTLYQERRKKQNKNKNEITQKQFRNGYIVSRNQGPTGLFVGVSQFESLNAA